MQHQQVAGCFAAFVFASLFAAFLAIIPFSLGASLDQFSGLLLLAFGIALGHAVVLGLPLFLALRQKGWVNAFSSIAGGFLVGATGGILLTLPRFNRGYSSSVNNVPHIIDGVPTAAGWLSYFGTLAFLGVLGALAGLAFWCILKWSGSARLTGEASQVAAYQKSKVGAAFAAAAVLATIAVFVFPAATTDRTCHNKFRDMRTIGGALARIDLSITNDDWPRLIRLFREFGEGEKLSFRNSGRDEFGAPRVLALSMCNELGANIEAGQETWAAGIGISIYQLREGAGSAKYVRDLAAKLELLWPGSVRFRDGRGQIISVPR
jgi:hypothetical protein